MDTEIAPKRARRSPPPECPVCRDPYTADRRRRVECSYCQAPCCTECLRTYLLTLQGDPHCMECKRAMNGEFLSMHLSSHWLLGEYKRHRERVLLDRQLALLPESQAMMENYRTVQRRMREIEAMDARRSALHEESRQLGARITTALARNDAARRSGYLDDGGGATRGARERREFVRACPVAECRGFLSTAWKCGTCEVRVCRECGEPRGEAGEDHACDPDVAASHRLVQKDSKPCPQCAAMIHKIDGCFGRDVPVLLWDGGVKMSQDVSVGDVLIGDDGRPRTVLALTRGEAPMYRVDQTRGMSYVVSDKHTLLFKVCAEGVREFGDRFKAMWMDRNTHAHRSKVFDDRQSADAFFAGLGLDPVVEMTVVDYLRLSKSHKRHAMAWKCDWETRPNKDDLCTGFTVTEVGTGSYYGWVVDGNHRFLLADFTVVHNCDQMWCTRCHVAFSWSTGRVITSGVFHNPHYFEWRRRGGGPVPRQPGDVPCGGLPDLRDLDSALRGADQHTRRALQAALRVVAHVQDVDVRTERDRAQRDVDPLRLDSDLRLRYLLGELDREAWSRELQRREKHRERAFAQLQIFEMFAGAAADTLRSLAQGAHDPETALAELRALRDYTNQSLEAVGARFKLRPRHLTGLNFL